MIQRIQSFWLVLAACCMALCFMTPVAEYKAEVESMQQTVQSEMNLLPKGEVTMSEEQLLTMGATIDYSQKMSGFKTWPLVTLAEENGIKIVMLTAALPEEVQAWMADNDISGLDYLFADATAIETMMRGNPGFMYIENATVVDKTRKAGELKIEK